MEKDEIKGKLIEGAVSSLERLAFIFSYPVEVPEREGMDDSVRAVVSFTGRLRGSLSIELPASALTELAGNMLGLDGETPSIEQQYDALGETANVICGSVLPSLAEESSIFDIGAPEITPIARGSFEMPDGKFEVRGYLELDQGSCTVKLRLDEEL